MLTFLQSKQTRAINKCMRGIVADPPMAWILIKPSIGHVALELQRRLKQQGIEISFKKACKIVGKRRKSGNNA